MNVTPDEVSRLREDFLEYSGGFPPWEAHDEVMLYLEHNVFLADEADVLIQFDVWEAEEAGN